MTLAASDHSPYSGAGKAEPPRMMSPYKSVLYWWHSGHNGHADLLRERIDGAAGI
jgi:hypothetical protein